MVKCIDCEHLCQGYLLLRKCNGSVIEDFQINKSETAIMFDSKGISNDNFECEEDHCSDGHPFILRQYIDTERVCEDFKSYLK
jgi:hypothetical protein